MIAVVSSYARAGKHGEAANFLNSILQANPDNAEARVLLGSLNAKDPEIPVVDGIQMIRSSNMVQPASAASMLSTRCALSMRHQ